MKLLFISFVRHFQPKSIFILEVYRNNILTFYLELYVISSSVEKTQKNLKQKLILENPKFTFNGQFFRS